MQKNLTIELLLTTDDRCASSHPFVAVSVSTVNDHVLP